MYIYSNPTFPDHLLARPLAMVTTLPSAGTGGEADSSDASSLELEELEEALPPSPVATHFLRQKEAPKNAAKPFLDPSQMFHARGDVSLFF